MTPQDTLTTGTLPLPLLQVLSYLMCIGGKQTPPTTITIRPMETITLTNNGNTIQLSGSYQEIAQFLLGLNVSAPASVVSNEPEELAPFNTLLQSELVAYFGEQDAALIVTALKRSYAIGDYRYLIPTYKIAGEDLKKRQLLKLVSAVHRYKFGGYKDAQKYSLRSVIKYAKACDECGQLANTLYTRLQKEGLI